MAAAYLERMGQRIRERREELHLSRPEVARAMPGKTTENQIYRWEKGLHRPQDDALEALAEVLKVDVNYFLASDDADREVTPDPFGGESFGARVARMELELRGLRTQVDGYAELIVEQNGLLARQSRVLEDIQALLSTQLDAARQMEAAAARLRAVEPLPPVQEPEPTRSRRSG